MKPFPELLAPAGNLQKLKTAVLYGADAVYLAGQNFSLRAGADNFSNQELQEAITFTRQHGVKLYVALNAFPHDSDLEGFTDYIQFLDELKIDAAIVSDLGMIRMIQSHSSIPIHLSTQSSCVNIDSALLWRDLGVKRIILGREVSIQQASDIKQQTGLEIELFIHGAMCSAFSGYCVISNYTQARDSNRGGCVQSCRFNYKIENVHQQSHAQSRFISSKDLNGLTWLPEFVQSGIDSLKIEGRMKSALYLATTVSAYVKGLKLVQENASRHQFKEIAQELKNMPHRTYTSGSLLQKADGSSVAESDHSNRKNGKYEMAGTILETTPVATLLVQNAFFKNTHLEALTFDGKIISLNPSMMTNLSKKQLDKAKPNTLVKLPFHHQLQNLNLVRMPID